jgi:hypothetical protein
MMSVLDAFVPLQNGGSANIELFATLALSIVLLAGVWKTFEKAGEPGWAGLIPIYNLYVMVRVSGNPWWWFLLCLIPLINLFAILKISIDVAGKFNRGALFGLGLALLSFIFFPILGFGGAQYQDRASRPGSTF